MAAFSFYWHDYETFGSDPRRDRPAQFAGLRTDADFNPLDEPLVIHCQPSEDYLPEPEACFLTGITPQYAHARGLAEPEFAARIHDALSVPGTCALGYNSLRFDDEVTRHLLYRNFFDPYAREWRGDNSRWDLLDVTRASYALRPEGIHWPIRDDGAPSFRLEDLTGANGIAHDAAHDALADVKATLAWARLLRARQPRLFDYLFHQRSKPAVLRLLRVGQFQPLLHVSGMYPARDGCLAVVLPLGYDPTNQNAVLVYNLAYDPTPWLDLDSEALRECLFTARDERPDGVERLPIKTVHSNKCPVLAPLTVLRPEDLARWRIDLARCQRHATQITEHAATWLPRLYDAFRGDFAPASDPEHALYQGFISDADRRLCERVRRDPPTQLATLSTAFQDRRLPELLFRYRARHYHDTLTHEEKCHWLTWRRAKLHNGHGGALTLAAYRARLNALQTRADSSLWHDLWLYGETLHARLKEESRTYQETGAEDWADNQLNECSD